MDDLTRINGIGKATAKKLGEAGIDTFEKLARLSAHAELAATLEVKPEWIEAASKIHAEAERAAADEAEAARLLQENSGAGNDPANAGSTDNREQSNQSGTGNAAGPAGAQQAMPNDAVGDASEKRAFAVTSTVLHDGKKHEPGGEPVSVTRTQFDALWSAGAVAEAWENGKLPR